MAPINLREVRIPVVETNVSSRLDLLFSRMSVILFYAAFIYPLFFVMDWHERPWDRWAALSIRLGCTAVMLGLAWVSRSTWGRPRAFLLASAGFLVAHLGFAAIVWHAGSFGSSNGDAFELLFGPYCVLVPVSTLEAAIVGTLMMGIQVSAYGLSGEPVSYAGLAWNIIPFFVIFLTGRHAANRVEVAWRRESVARSTLEGTLAQLRVAQTQLVESEKMAAIGRVAAGLSHELKNPLFVIGSGVSTLLRVAQLPAGTAASAVVNETLEGLRLAAESAAEVCDLLRRFSTEPQAEPAPVDMNLLVEEALLRLEMKVALKQAVVRTQYGELRLVRGDRRALIQVFVSIIDNALDAIGPKGNVRISTSLDPVGLVSLMIQDDGCGIASGHLPRIFEPFFTTKAPGRGTGLGLALCRSTVEKCGGTIWVENSNPGVIVTIRIPANEH